MERRQGKPGRRESIDERAGRRQPSSGDDDDRRLQPRDGCRPRGTAGRCRSDNAEAEAYPLWNWLPVEVTEEPRDVFNFRAPRGEHKSGGTAVLRTD